MSDRPFTKQDPLIVYGATRWDCIDWLQKSGVPYLSVFRNDQWARFLSHNDMLTPGKWPRTWRYVEVSPPTPKTILAMQLHCDPEELTEEEAIRLIQLTVKGENSDETT